MGGFGSGRHASFGAKRTTDASLPLDLRLLHRSRYLQRGAYCTLQWGCGSSVACLAQADGVLLIYSQGTENVQQPVALEWTACRYGGQRPWWRCPHCGRRVAVLYGVGARFRCRYCCRLAYRSQRESRSDRALSRASKLQRRLGQSGSGIMAGLPDKPPPMHWRTYRRLVEQMLAAQREYTSWFQQWSARMNEQMSRL